MKRKARRRELTVGHLTLENCVSKTIVHLTKHSIPWNMVLLLLACGNQLTKNKQKLEIRTCGRMV